MRAEVRLAEPVGRIEVLVNAQESHRSTAKPRWPARTTPSLGFDLRAGAVRQNQTEAAGTLAPCATCQL
jgi:hypothetical protein